MITALNHQVLSENSRGDELGAPLYFPSRLTSRSTCLSILNS
jgi:hypothetical protein